MQRFVVVVGLFGVIITSPSYAAAEPPAQGCLQTAVKQPDLDACAHRQALQANEHLNKAYRDLLRYLGSEGTAQLAAAERAWLAFRDADCAFFGGGDRELAPMNEAFCRAELTEASAKELESWPPNAPRDALAPLH